MKMTSVDKKIIAGMNNETFEKNGKSPSLNNDLQKIAENKMIFKKMGIKQINPNC